MAGWQALTGEIRGMEQLQHALVSSCTLRALGIQARPE